MTDRLHDLLQDGPLVLTLWMAISIPVALTLGRIVRRRDSDGTEIDAAAVRARQAAGRFAPDVS